MPNRSVSLDGSWFLKDFDHEQGEALGVPCPEYTPIEWIEATVPGDVHQDIERAGWILDPLVDKNLESVKWVPYKEWWYRREVNIPEDFLMSKTELVFDGIDLYGTVWVNGHKVGGTDNSFRQFRIDVTDAIRPGKNSVVVRVGATLAIADRFDCERYFGCFNIQRIFTRKAQCQFSWDWAPHQPAVGIWRSVRLETSNPGNIKHVYVRPRCDGTVLMHVTLDEKTSRQDLDQSVGDRVDIGVCKPTGHLVYEVKGHGATIKTKLPVNGGQNYAVLKVPNPQLWWPNGMGEQPLYQYKITYQKKGKTLDTQSGRFGIREIQVVEEPVGETQQVSFRFVVNGRPMFCKGANWVPAHCFPGVLNDETYQHLLEHARAANFNTLRIWGGGIYEKDIFYDLCDELGLCVWQDFMFACSDIPDDQHWFEAMVIEEMQYQVTRLRNHPSLLYWCGGNEKTGSAGFLVSYGEKVYNIIARGIVGHLDPDRQYRPASPHSWTDMGNDPETGDTHGGAWEHAFADNPTKFREWVAQIRSVFNSEFGYHGPGRFRSLKKFISEQYVWPPNEVWDYHTTDNPYNSLPETYLQAQMGYAEKLFGEFNDAPTFIKHASMAHAEILRHEMEHHRRRKWTNSGGMFWMYNDNWPCGTWAVVDFYGTAKPAYYAISRACAPIILSLREYEGKVEVWGINDTSTTVRGTLVFGQQDLTGTKSKGWKKTKKVSLAGDSSVCLHSFPSKDLRSGKTLVVYAQLNGSDLPVQQATYFPKLWRDVPWPDPQLMVNFGNPKKTKTGQWQMEVTVACQQYARAVSVSPMEDIKHQITDNYFDLLSGQSKTVVLTTPSKVDQSQVRVDHWLTAWD